MYEAYSLRIKLLEYPLFNNKLVRIIGSKKKPMFPINLEEKHGILVSSISFMILFLGMISLFLILICFGKKRKKIKVLTISVIMLSNMNVIIPFIVSSFGKIMIKNIILILCSMIFDKVFGRTFILPKKYPLKIDDRAINGSVRAMAFKIGVTSFCFSKVVAIKGEA